MIKINKGAVSLAVLGFFMGSLLFFPLNSIRTQVVNLITANTGLPISIQRIRFGTGLGMGLLRGGLFAIKATDARIGLPNGEDLNCDVLSISPHLTALFTAQLKVGVECVQNKKSVLSLSASGRPLWNLTKMDIEADLKDLDLAPFEGIFDLSPLKAQINGTLSADAFPINGRMRQLGPIAWNLQIHGLTTPSVNSDFINVPSLTLEQARTKGSFKGGQLKVSELTLGTKSSPIQANWTMDFTLDGMNIPTAGEWKGMLRTDANFESTMLKDINLDLLFGKVKSSGQREFRKPINGNAVMDLLMKPPLDNPSG